VGAARRLGVLAGRSVSRRAIALSIAHRFRNREGQVISRRLFRCAILELWNTGK
jgi:hypothetical protein